MLMADSQPSRKPQQKKKLLLGLDGDSAAAAAAAEAAQQLMQLSDEDYNSDKKNGDEEDSQQSKDEITWRKIEEIFGKEEENNFRPKKRRYRSLVSLYKATKPMPFDYKIMGRS